MGAWIETLKAILELTEKEVAPRMGAWIETAIGKQIIKSPTLSRPAWARGLKQSRPVYHKCLLIVAPRMGAWIETGYAEKISSSNMSRPAWARGLKLISRSLNH